MFSFFALFSHVPICKSIFRFLHVTCAGSGLELKVLEEAIQNVDANRL